jgi:hypothetical protein
MRDHDHDDITIAFDIYDVIVIQLCSLMTEKLRERSIDGLQALRVFHR